MRVVQLRYAHAHIHIREAPLCNGVGQQTAVGPHQNDKILVVNRITQVVRRLFRFAKLRRRSLDLILHRFQDGIVRRANWRWRRDGLVARRPCMGHSGKLRDEHPAGRSLPDSLSAEMNISAFCRGFKDLHVR